MSVTGVLWACLAVVVYHYAGYPLLLFVVSSVVQGRRDLRFLISRRSRRCALSGYTPTVALIFSAFNEEEVIGPKLENTRLLDYPDDKLQVLLGLDAPTDATSERVASATWPALQVFHFPARRGKLAVLRDLVQRATADILVFTDANTLLDPGCIRALVRHFSDRKVGVASGEEIRLGKAGCAGESLYWRYESAIRILESRLNLLLGANGSLYAIRRELFNSTHCPSFAEDFQIPAEIRFKGHRVVYDPEAIALEDIVPTVQEQFQRRVRVAAGSYQTLFRSPHFLNPLKGAPVFAYFSHRLLRWLVPYLLPIIFLCSFILRSHPFYAALLGTQAAFYSTAAAGYWRQKRGKSARLLVAPLQFCMMNLAYIIGLLRSVTGRQTLVWNATPRHGSLPDSPGREFSHM
jgi:cellulose synthase/poly-beta-1,6-N-acetylglucosamine synthase-like glycosyltransferase